MPPLTRLPGYCGMSQVKDPVLNICIKGEKVSEGKIALRDLALFGHELQFAFETVARLYLGEKVAKRGVLPHSLRIATDIVVVSVEKGSFVMTLDLPQSRYSSLGDQALRSLLLGLKSLYDRSWRLPNQYDNSVLKAWHNMGRLFERGIEAITFDLTTPEEKIQVVYGCELYFIINDRVTGVVTNTESLEGDLLMVDFSQMRCRLHLPSGETINCKFDKRLIEKVSLALRKYVRIDGTVSREITTRSISKLQLRDITILNKSELEYPLAENFDENLWLIAASRNFVFNDLYDAEEDIYSIHDGKPFYD